MRKKLFIIIIIVILFSSIISTLSYLWVLNPISFTPEIVIEDLSEFTYAWLTMNQDKIDLEAFDGKLPSDNCEDYRSIAFEFQVNYRSAFYIENFQAIVESIDTENRKYVVWAGNSGFREGETTPGHFMKRTVSGLNVKIYVGDLKNEEEIREVALDIARHTKIKVLYNMQWIGNRECEFTFPEDFTTYSFYNCMTGEVETYE